MKFNLKIFLILNLISLFSLFFLSIFQASFLAQKIFLQKEYQRKIAELSRENEILSINLSKSNSIFDHEFENYFLNNGFVKARPEKIKYIQILREVLVSKPFQ